MIRFILKISVCLTILISLLSCSGEKKPQVFSKEFESSSFNKQYFESDKYLIVNVWDSGSGNIFDKFYSFEEKIDTSKVNLVTVCIEKDLNFLESYSKYSLKKDITSENLAVRNEILEAIDYPTDEKKGVVQVKVRRTPYIAVVKDKKLVYSAYEYNLDKIFSIINGE